MCQPTGKGESHTTCVQVKQWVSKIRFHRGVATSLVQDDAAIATLFLFTVVTVTDGERKECVDLGKREPFWMLGEVGDLVRQAGGGTGRWHQTVEEVRRSQDVGRHRRQARHNTKPCLCTEYVSYVHYV
jgi:hypothetical protein